MKKNVLKLSSANEETKNAFRIFKGLKRTYPNATIALESTSPLELLIATILSAQCTDERVNIVTKPLFKRYRSAKEFANANKRELEGIIKSTGFYHAKAKNIIGCCTLLLEKFGGKVPSTMDELIQLPGVGRKTANVVLGSVFGITEGIVVDTHVKRLSGRLGFTQHTQPEKIEQDLMQLFPKRDWILLPHLLIRHGRALCKARNPKCTECPVNDLCPASSTLMD
jgi:endonuclease-3